MDLTGIFPEKLVQFALVTLFSLIIGLSQRHLHMQAEEEHKLFGTDRTLTFIGILGYLLFIFDPFGHALYLAGGVILAAFLAIYYYHKITILQEFGLTTIIIAMLTYCLAPLCITQPLWLFLIVVVTIIFFAELKGTFISFTSQITRDEFLTLGKFLVIAGVILPIVPDRPIVSFLSVTPYKVWLTVVIISSISYISYLLKKFVFKNSGIILSGILGGLYSSTATTLVLARKSKEDSGHLLHYVAGILLSICMMYLRVLLLVFIFNKELFAFIAVYFILMAAVTGIAALVFILRSRWKVITEASADSDRNPLEFKVALAFTLLFIAFSFITYYTITTFGNLGLSVLSWIVGVTDIDPFLINLFEGKYQVTMHMIGIATMQAIVSNNIVKCGYAAFLGNKKMRKDVLTGLVTIIIINAILLFII
jgi:uncharacterized membrane protein (DUF4010 family)